MKRTIESKKSNFILKKLLISSILQILCFCTTNIICESLISQKLSSFKGKINEIQNQLSFFGSIFEISYLSNLIVLRDQKFLAEFSEQNIDFNTIVSNSYEKLRKCQDLVQFQNSKIDINFNYEGFSNETDAFNLMILPYLLGEIVFNYAKNISSNARFFMTNLNSLTEISSTTINTNFSDLNSDNVIFPSFYLTLNLVCFFLIFCIQLFSFPLIKKHRLYLEKILTVVTRLKEKECHFG